ncbi:hypothetical protein GGR54DRAFT_621303 [Hypoxylon sp. NC1633]|nr:hypothetical protein GGR54DRAFT_621303 [Hypoxylon sp. NC1633]
MLAQLLFLVASLGAALAGPAALRETIDDATTSVAAPVSTITGYAHPLALVPLTTLGEEQTPLSYDSPPTAITVPTRLVPSGVAAAEATGIHAEAEKSPDAVTGDAPTVTAVCTSIAGVYPTATIPNFCNPSVLVNAPSFLPARSNLPTATVTVGGVTNKLDCCIQCASIFNCLAWHFVPVYTQKPNPHLPGGFDPWGRGDCEAIYHTGDPEEEVAAGIILVGHDEDTANLCPNGKAGEILGASDEGVVSNTSSWMNLYYNGWNEGPCGEPAAPFESGQDAGKGDADDLCSLPIR